MRNHAAAVRRRGKPRQQNVSSDINAEYIFSSSVGATARCELSPVEKYLSICPYLSPTLSLHLLTHST